MNVGALEILVKEGSTVTAEIVISPRENKSAASDIAKFNAQYGGLTVRPSASLKDLSGNCFAFTLLDTGEIVGVKAQF